MSVAVGDFLALGQLAFTLYRQCYLVARGAPQEFQSLVSELTTLTTCLKLLQDEVENADSLLVRSGEDRLRMIQEMIKRVEATLLELEKFSAKYAKLLDPSRSKTRKVWDKFKWSTEMGDIDGLRNKVRNSLLKCKFLIRQPPLCASNINFSGLKLVYHNGVIHLLLTSAGK